MIGQYELSSEEIGPVGKFRTVTTKKKVNRNLVF
jgi:hypothetical protein